MLKQFIFVLGVAVSSAAQAQEVGPHSEWVQADQVNNPPNASILKIAAESMVERCGNEVVITCSGRASGGKEEDARVDGYLVHMRADRCVDAVRAAGGMAKADYHILHGVEGQDGHGVELSCFVPEARAAPVMDSDGDGISDLFDNDLDNDGIPNNKDPDMKGPKGDKGDRGERGAPGQACWDLDGNGKGDMPDPDSDEDDPYTEDTNGDGIVDVGDCRPSGGGGGQWHISFIPSYSYRRGSSGFTFQAGFGAMFPKQRMGFDVFVVTGLETPHIYNNDLGDGLILGGGAELRFLVVDKMKFKFEIGLGVEIDDKRRDGFLNAAGFAERRGVLTYIPFDMEIGDHFLLGFEAGVGANAEACLGNSADAIAGARVGVQPPRKSKKGVLRDLIPRFYLAFRLHIGPEGSGDLPPLEYGCIQR